MHAIIYTLNGRVWKTKSFKDSWELDKWLAKTKVQNWYQTN